MATAMQGVAQIQPTAAGATGALHMIKLCVGVESVEELQRWQDHRASQRRERGEDPRPFHVTRMTPRRIDELLDGGSLYWVIRGVVRVRQTLDEIEPFDDADGVSHCRLVFDPTLTPVEFQPRRPFQGWRYLTGADAPRDLPDWRVAAAAADRSPMPRELEEAVAAYGVL